MSGADGGPRTEVMFRTFTGRTLCVDFAGDVFQFSHVLTSCVAGYELDDPDRKPVYVNGAYVIEWWQR